MSTKIILHISFDSDTRKTECIKKLLNEAQWQIINTAQYSIDCECENAYLASIIKGYFNGSESSFPVDLKRHVNQIFKGTPSTHGHFKSDEVTVSFSLNTEGEPSFFK